MKCETIEEKNGNNNNERSSHWRMRFQQWRWAGGGIERGKKGSEKMNNENNPIHASNNKKSNAWFEFFNEFVHSIQCIQFFFCALYPKLSKKFFESSLNPANTNKWTTTFRAQHTVHRAMLLFIILHVVFDSLSCTRSFLSQSRAFSQTAINHFYIRNVLIMIIKPCE